MVGNQFWKKIGLVVAASLPVVAFGQDPAPAPAPMAVAGAGGFLEDPVSPTLRDTKAREAQVRGTVMRILKGQDALAGPNQVIFDSYFKSYQLPLLTQSDAKALEKLPGNRVKFYRDFLEVQGGTPVEHEALAVLVLEYMTKVADGNYHPAVRYNAMMMIGMLNITEATKLGPLANRTIADPFPLAYTAMKERFDAPETLDLVRLAALMGMVRHLDADNYRDPGSPTKMAKGDRTELINLLVTLAQQKDPPAYRNADGQLWMRRKAIEGLGYALVMQPEPALLDVLDKLIQDDEDDLTVRTAAAVALGRMPVNANVKYNAVVGVQELGKLLVDVLQTESNRLVALREYEATRVGPVSGVSTGGGGGGLAPRTAPGPGPRVRLPRGAMEHDPYGLSGVAGLTPLDPKAYRVTASRRLLRGQIRSIELAIAGVDDRAEPKSLPPEPRGVKAQAAAPKVKTDAENLQAELKSLAKFLEEECDGLDTKAYEEKLAGKVQLAAATFNIAAPAPAVDPMAAPGEAVPGEVPGDLPGDVPGAVPAAPMAKKPPMPAPPVEVPGDVPGDVPAAP